jgi:protocatechuate 3,4-dioxygenase, beta subunit
MSLSRREWLRMMAVSGVALAGTPLLFGDDDRVETPNLMVGPFYPLTKPLDRDADLTRVRGRKGQAAGQVVDVRGRILNRNGEPVRNARVEIWQANSHGRYAHPSDPNTDAPLDPNFQGFAIQSTDSEGRYRFRTIKPGPYPAQGGARMRAPHLHFDVQGRLDRKVTQMFFPGEPLNSQDRLLLEVPRHRETLIAALAPNADDDAMIVTWDITLAKG